MNIFVSSSRRNEKQSEVVAALRKLGHEVYDFHNPDGAPGLLPWDDESFTPEAQKSILQYPLATKVFERDMVALQEADVVVGVMPFGRSACLEMGWAAGHGKRTIVLLAAGEPELMMKMFSNICVDLAELVEILTHEVITQYFTVRTTGYVIIHGPTKEKCREKMFEEFGTHWAMQYDTADAAGVDRHGLALIAELYVE